ncbi:MAG: hypothetical protein ACYC91_10820 [Solirubrobacteraceae bacterium]
MKSYVAIPEGGQGVRPAQRGQGGIRRALDEPARRKGDQGQEEADGLVGSPVGVLEAAENLVEQGKVESDRPALIPFGTGQELIQHGVAAVKPLHPILERGQIDRLVAQVRAGQCVQDHGKVLGIAAEQALGRPEAPNHVPSERPGEPGVLGGYRPARSRLFGGRFRTSDLRQWPVIAPHTESGVRHDTFPSEGRDRSQPRPATCPQREQSRR